MSAPSSPTAQVPETGLQKLSVKAKELPTVQAQWETDNANRMADSYLFESLEQQTFISADPLEALSKHLAAEQLRTEWLNECLRRAWEEVEEGQRRAADRQAFLNTILPKLLKDGYSSSHFWSYERFRTHFNLTSILDLVPMHEDSGKEGGADSQSEVISSAAAAQLPKGHILTIDKRQDCIRIKKSWAAAAAASSNGSKSGPSPPNQPASDRQLLRPSSRFAPLRRCFSTLLQQKDSYPKNMALLFTHVEAMQQLLATIEASMDQCMLHVPLYKPLQRIALCIARDLSKAPPGVATTEAFKARNDEMLTTLVSSMRELLEDYEREVAEVPAAATSIKGRMGAAMWGVLLTELTARKGLHERAVQYIEDSLEAEKEQQTDLRSAVATCQAEVEGLLSSTANETSEIVEDVRSTTSRLAEVTNKAARIYTSQKKLYEEQIKEQGYRASASAEAQVKIQRNIRQLFKELAKEQAKHTSAVTDLTACNVNLAKLESAYEGLSAAAKVRKDTLEEAEAMCKRIEQLVADTTSVCGSLTTEMGNHAKRCINAETVRKCGATVIAVGNMKEWRRIAGDLSALYQHTDDEVSKRVRTAPDGSVTITNNSWQLDFLLSNARKVAAEKLQFIRTETVYLDQKWANLVQTYAEPYEVAVPDKLQVDEDPITLTKRQVLIELEVARKYMRTKEAAPLSFEDFAERPSALIELVRRAQLETYEEPVTSPSTQAEDEGDQRPREEAVPEVPPATTTDPLGLSPHAASILATATTLRDSSLTTKTIIPTFAKFEAELENLRKSHKMRNTSDYSKKADKEAAEAKRATASSKVDEQKVADAISGAGTAAALLRSQRRASQSEAQQDLPKDDGEDEAADSSPPPPPPPRGLPTMDEPTDVPIVPRPPPRR